MSGVGELLNRSRGREERLRKTEEFLAKHLHDHLFMDYFNVFLNLPVFGQRMLIKLHDGNFIFDPPVFTAVNHDRLVAWIAARRFHLFTKTHLFLEYQLCHKLRNLDFELRFKDSDCDRRTHHVLQVFANNLLGSVAGMYLFREHLRNSSGSSVLGCWLHVQRFRQTRNLAKRREMFHEVQQRYLLASAIDKLSNRLCKVVALELLSFPVVPHSETELSARLTTDHYVPSCEVDLSSPEALALVHRVLLEALRSYWAPCYVMHVLSTQPFSILKELFRVPTGSVIQNVTDLKMLIRRCTLFKVSGDLDSTPKHDALSSKDEWSMPTISTSSSILSPASSSSTHITSNPQESTFTYLPYLQSLTEASRISALAMRRGHLSTRDQLHPEDTGFIVPKLPSIEITQGQASQSRGDTSDEDLTEVCVVEELLDTERYCDYTAQESRRHEEKKEAKKVSDEMEDDDDSKVRLNLTRLALKEMALKPEPMLYLNQLLRHYIFGYRHLDQEKPVTDRRTLCLLACDDLAGSPFRSYLAGQDQQLHFSYFDFWSAMRRYQQLHDLNRMGDIMHTKNCTMIADLRRQHIRYMVKRFLMGSGVDANILDYKIRLSLLEDIRKARWSPLINSALDVVSNVLSIPMTQFILYDRQDFRKHAMNSSSPLSYLEQDSQAEDIMASRDSSSPFLNLEHDSQAEDIMASGLPMKIPSVLHSLLKRRSEAASLRTFADRRCLSDPWREDPKHDPEGDMECLRPTDPRGTKYDGVVGVLGEQHRLLAFQFLIVLREDLPGAQVCGVTSLARIVRSDYGSLHIPFSAPVNHRFLASLRPKQRISRATLLKPSPFIEVEVFPCPVIKRLGPMETLTMNDLLETRRNRNKLELKRPKTPRNFLDILADEMQYNYFKKYLELKGQLKAVTFVEDVQDALRLKDKAEKEMMVAGIIEQFFGDGDRILTIGENKPVTFIIGESPNLETLRSAQLALEKQIEKTWFQKYVEELQLHKVDLPPSDQGTSKDDWLENYLLVQEEIRRKKAEENERRKKRLQKIKEQEQQEQEKKEQKKKRKVKKVKRQKHTEKIFVHEDFENKYESEESNEDNDIKSKESSDSLGEVEKDEWKAEKESFRERKKKPQAKKGKKKHEHQDKKHDRAKARSLPAHSVKRKRDRKIDKQETGKQVHEKKRVTEREEQEFKEQEHESEEITSVSETESEEEQDQEDQKSRLETLDRKKQTFEDFKQEKIKKNERREEYEGTSAGTASLNQMTSKRQAKISIEEEKRKEVKEEYKKSGEDDEGKSPLTASLNQMTSKSQAEISKEEEEAEEKKEVKEEYEKSGEDEGKSPLTASLNQMTSKSQAERSKEKEEAEEKKEVKEEYEKSGEDDEGTSPGTASLNQMTSKRQSEISKGEEEIKEEKKRDLEKKKSMKDEVDRLKESEKEKKDEKANIVLRSEKVADETNLARIKSHISTDAQGHKATLRILQARKYSSPAAIKEEIHKGKEEKGAYQNEEIYKEKKEDRPEKRAYRTEESVKSESFEEFLPALEYFKHMQYSAGAMPESTESSIVLYDRAKGLTRKAKPLDLWRHVVTNMMKFTSSLNRPRERQLFEMYLKQELQNAKNNLTSDKESKTTDSEGIEHVVYTRQILHDLFIQVNKLPADLRFFVEATRFKKQMIAHVKCFRNIGIPIEMENPILGMRAEAIIECFFQSVCEPAVQVNLCTEKNVSQIIKRKSRGLSVDLFDDIYIRLYPMLFKMWKIFAKRWLSRHRVNQRKENIEMLLASFKDPIIGDFPHPHEPSADYLHLKMNDCKNSRATDKEVKEVTGSMLKFTISRGIRLLVNEAEQKRLNKLSSDMLPEINENRNNSCKESVAINVEKDKKRDNVFCETQYMEPGKIDRSKNCPGNSDTVGSRVKLPALVKALECRERKSHFGIGRTKVQKTCNNFPQDQDCVVAIQERGRKHQPKPESRQKGGTYSEPKICSEPRGMTSGHTGGKKAKKGKNDETSAHEDQTSNHRSNRRETQNKRKPKFREGDKQMDNDSSQKFTKRTDRDTKIMQTEMRQHGKQEHKMQEANRAFMCVSGQSEELQLLNPVFLSRSLPPLDGCLQLQDNQSVWGPGKRAFKGDCAEQGSVDVAESIYVVVKDRHYCDQWKLLHKDLLSFRDWTTTSNAGREF